MSTEAQEWAAYVAARNAVARRRSDEEETS